MAASETAKRRKQTEEKQEETQEEGTLSKEGEKTKAKERGHDRFQRKGIEKRG